MTGVPTASTEPAETLSSRTRPSIGLMTWVFCFNIPAIASICRRASLRVNSDCCISRALRLQIRLLRSQLQDFVSCIFLSLLRIGQVATAILDIASGGVSLGQQVLEVLEVDRQIFDALVGRLHDLIEGGLELCKVLAL